jgi:hypothetical protein
MKGGSGRGDGCVSAGSLTCSVNFVNVSTYTSPFAPATVHLPTGASRRR